MLQAETKLDAVSNQYPPNQIKHYRLLRGLTQAELGARSQMSRAHVANLEDGRRKLWHDQMTRLSQALDVTVAELINS